MVRLTALLIVGMFLALLIGGEDRGQLRPGLAKAAAEGRLDTAPAAVIAAAPEAPVEVVQTVAAPKPQIVAAPEPQVVAAVFTPAEPEQPRRTAEPVFTLSGIVAPPLPEPEADPLAEVQPNPNPVGDGQIWYVTANSVNVRQSPSTEASVMGKLTRGEAATVMWQEGDEWARIIIEGDGLEGYVATRFLSPSAP